LRRIRHESLVTQAFIPRPAPRVGPAPAAMVDETQRRIDANATPAFEPPFTLAIGGKGGVDRPERSTPVHRE